MNNIEELKSRYIQAIAQGIPLDGVGRINCRGISCDSCPMEIINVPPEHSSCGDVALSESGFQFQDDTDLREKYPEYFI